jgi:hypothetical protein
MPFHFLDPREKPEQGPLLGARVDRRFDRSQERRIVPVTGEMCGKPLIHQPIPFPIMADAEASKTLPRVRACPPPQAFHDLLCLPSDKGL